MQKANKNIKKMRAAAESIFRAGLAAVAPESAVARYCRIEAERLWVGDRCYDLAEFKNIYVIGCGKAAAAMAKALERLLGGRITAGIVIVKYGHLAHLGRIQIVEAGHPVPDHCGEEGARRVLALAESAGRDDLVLCLISGGGSALLPLPAAAGEPVDWEMVNRIRDEGFHRSQVMATLEHLTDVIGTDHVFLNHDRACFDSDLREPRSRNIGPMKGRIHILSARVSLTMPRHEIKQCVWLKMPCRLRHEQKPCVARTRPTRNEFRVRGVSRRAALNLRDTRR